MSRLDLWDLFDKEAKAAIDWWFEQSIRELPKELKDNLYTLFLGNMERCLQNRKYHPKEIEAIKKLMWEKAARLGLIKVVI